MNESIETVAQVVRKVKELPSPEALKECFEYLPDTGELRWKKRPLDHFVSAAAFSIWNAKVGGKIAGTKTVNKKKEAAGRTQYISLTFHIKGVKFCFQAHRVIYHMCIGECPPNMQVDHKDGNGLNNRLENLRLATCQQNSYNSRNRRGPKIFLGLPRGVSRTKCGFMATIGVHYKIKYLGVFPTAELAGAAYQAAYKEYAGEFARNAAHQEST